MRAAVVAGLALWSASGWGYGIPGPLVSKRSEFDQTVNKWKQENPVPISDAAIELLWERFLESSSRDTASLAAPKPPPMQKRATTMSATEITAARKLVDAAINKSSESNVFLNANPRRNHYELKPRSAPKLGQGDADSEPYPPELREAAIKLTELDAATGGMNTSQHLHRRALGPYWLEELGRKYPGTNPFGQDSAGYKVFRNVRDYGATGDGLKDDTDAINKAIKDGNRCTEGCGSTTVKGAIVYFPAGTYLVSRTTVALYHTQLVGDPKNLPVILTTRNFYDREVITSNIYTGKWNDRWNMDGEWYLNTANFFRQIRNFVVDIRPSVRPIGLKALHWQVAQATSLQNIHIKMAEGSTQVGLFIENGSGGLLSDLTFEGGEMGMLCGNQQFTSRNLRFRNCKTAISMLWDWGWVWKELDIIGGEVGINFTTSDFPGGSITVLDSNFQGVKTAVLLSSGPKKSDKQTSLSIINVRYQNVGTMVSAANSGASLQGGSGTISSYFIGNTFSDAGSTSGFSTQKDAFVNGAKAAPRLEPAITNGLGTNADNSGGYYSRGKPQYEGRNDWLVPSAKGDGQTDDTAALNLAFKLAAEQKKPVFLPAGSYIVTDTVFIPPGSIIVGACWSQIVASGKRFEDMQNPHVMVKVGNKGDVGTVEISDLLFTARGPTAGLVAMEWNIKASSKGAAGMWDSHFRIGGAAGTNLQVGNCPKISGAVKPNCVAGSLLLHLTDTSSAYLENVWVWVADHDLDDLPSLSEAQIDIYVARGILIESKEATWLYATSSEHSVLYQYQLNRASNVFMGLIQTESAYFHPQPTAPTPFEKAIGKFPSDPDFKECNSDATCKVSWALAIYQSSNVHIVGAGLYSWFFDNYNQDCIEKRTCQKRILWIDDATSGLYMYNLFTVGVEEMFSMPGGKAVLAKDNVMLADKKPFPSILAAVVKVSAFQPTAQSMTKSFPFPDHCKGLDECMFGKMKENSDKGWDTCYHQMGNSKGLGDCKQPENPAVCPTALPCNKYDNPEEYWMVEVMNNFNNFAGMIYKKTFSTVVESVVLGDVDHIAKGIADLEDKDLGTKKILKIMSQALGFVALATGAKGWKYTDYINLAGLTFDTAQEHLDEEKKKEEAEKQALLTMKDTLKLFLRQSRTALSETLRAFFFDGKLDRWDPANFPDKSKWTYGKNQEKKLEHPVTQFLSDHRYMYLIDDEMWNKTGLALEKNIRMGLTIAALDKAKLYMVHGGAPDEKACGAHSPSSRWIERSCYTLHKLGPGNTGPTVMGPGAFTRPVDQGMVDLILPDNLESIYRGSIDCQKGHTDKYPARGIDTGGVMKAERPGEDADKYFMGKCFFNVPILYVEPQRNDPAAGSPCEVLARSKKGATPKVGENVLPPILAEAVNDKFCRVECSSKDCLWEQEPCRGRGGGGPACLGVPGGGNDTVVAE